MADWGMILAPTLVRVSFKARPVPIMLHSLQLANGAENISGVGEWITQTAHSLSKQQRLEMSILCENLPDRLAFEYQDATFPELIAGIQTMTGEDLRDNSCVWMQEKSQFTSFDDILNNFDRYKAFMTSVYAEKGITLENEFIEANFAIIHQPSALKQHVINQLNFFWENYLQAEWQRTEPMLQEVVEAFNQNNYVGMKTADIVESVTNRNLRSKEYFEDEMNKTEHIIFMPSPHLGPYVSWISNEKNGDDIVIFGAHLPKNTAKKSKALNHVDLLIQINALADETRLKMLEMLTNADEIYAQDFITQLDLSQSSASRHLRQLTASGYIHERRRDVAKCYSLNRDRIKETMKALGKFLD
jgi:ArsR family transcriptional regulator